jgi:hypothetical protein
MAGDGDKDRTWEFIAIYELLIEFNQGFGE